MPPSPRALVDPSALWLFPTVCYVGFAVILVSGIVSFLRNRRLSITMLGLLAGTTMWWAEWYGDWASYLRYNPKYALIPWSHTTWTTPSKPWFMIPAYGLYYAVAIPIGLKVVGAVRRRFPTLNHDLALLVLVPYFLVEDLLIEIPATRWGWWNYLHIWGPALHSTRGTLPLLYPMFFTTAFVIVASVLIDRRDENDVCHFERPFGVDRLGPGLRRELSRLAAWTTVLNIGYVVVLVGPLVVLRLIFGPANAFVP